MRHPALRVTAIKKLFKNIVFFLIFNWIFDQKIEKIDFSKILKFSHFYASGAQPSYGFSTSIRPIDALFLPDGIYFVTRPFRKWPQIEIWTYEVSSNFDFKTLALRKCYWPSAGQFSQTSYYSSRSDETSCSTSH